MKGIGFMFQGLRFEFVVQGLGFRVKDLGFTIQGLRFLGFKGFRVQGSGLRV